MKKNLFLPILLACAAALNFCEAKSDSSLFGSAQEQQVVVNNRILAKVNGKAISVIDLMKKMDMLFYKQFPQYTSSPQARYHFYQANWKHALSEMIDKELILADAQESKLVISAGDVRQEMESLFGPNIIDNLDKIGLTFSEASKLVLADITIRRMVYFRVQLPAINQVTPQQIYAYYEDFAKDNIRDNEWIYNVITLRHKDPTKGAEMANLAYNMLTEEKLPLSELKEKLKGPQSQMSLTVSEEFRTNEKELSDGFKRILTTLTSDTYSMPIVQKSRADNTTVFRIFYLKDMTPGGIIPFSELEGKIKEKLTEEAMEKETVAYIARLRQHFDVQETQLKEILSSDFQPFMLK
jgi:antitoxin component of RelBE/YafQ-DinJ toxin-antitoxin module